MNAVRKLHYQRKLRLIATLLQTAYDTAFDLPQHKDQLILAAREDVLKLIEEIRRERQNARLYEE